MSFALHFAALVAAIVASHTKNIVARFSAFDGKLARSKRDCTKWRSLMVIRRSHTGLVIRCNQVFRSCLVLLQLLRMCPVL